MPSLHDLADEYLRERTLRRDITPLTARNHRSALLSFAACADGPVCDLTYRDVERWLATKRRLAASTRRSQFSAVKSFCDWLHRQRLVDRSPAADVRAPKLPRSIPRALEVDHVARLLVACPDERARAIVWLMVGMGLRCVEVSQLELGEWDRGRGVMTVHGKAEHSRTLPVPQTVALAVDLYLLNHPAVCGPLVRSYRQPNEPLAPDTVSRLVQEWMSASGIKKRPRDGVSAHALRHTAASDVLDECGDIRIVQQMLGHRHISSTQVYLRRAALGAMREAMAGRTYAA